jgi:hypothetical protein
MANYFIGNVDKWLLLSESETDYAIHFVRCWIAFNAWYCNHYKINADRLCIEKIKSDNNQFRTRLIALLGNADETALKFKLHIAQMHSMLEAYPIPNADKDDQITFRNICYRINPVVSPPSKNRRNLEYKVERLSNRSVKAMIVSKNRTGTLVTKYQYSHKKFDNNHFQADLNAVVLLEEQKKYLSECFFEIDPKKKESLLSLDKRNFLDIGGISFINNRDLLSMAIIEVLYSLRCKLFHGELQPSKDNLKVYEPAYNILRILNKSLI